MFYSAVNVSELQNFRSVYSQKHLLIADSDKNICDKQLDLLVFRRNLLMLGFNIVIGIPQCLHSKYYSNYYFLYELLLYGNQSISFYIDKIMNYNVNRSPGFHIVLSLLFMFFSFSIFKNHQLRRFRTRLSLFETDNGDTRITSLTLF